MSRNVSRLRNENYLDYYYIVKDFLWDDPVKIDNGIYLGNVSHSFFYGTFQNFNITGVVNVTETSPNFYHENSRSRYLDCAGLVEFGSGPLAKPLGKELQDRPPCRTGGLVPAG